MFVIYLFIQLFRVHSKVDSRNTKTASIQFLSNFGCPNLSFGKMVIKVMLINMNQTISKFSSVTLNAKKNIRLLRLARGYSMNEGARLLSVSRKQLEDIETARNYGCHLDLELLAKVKVIYDISLDDLFGELPSDYFSDYYTRPRKKLDAV